MSPQKKQHRSRGRRYLGALAGLAVGAAAVLVPAGAASAQPGGSVVPKDVAKYAITKDKLPAGAVRATRGMPKQGSHGAPFQSAPKAGTSAPRVIGGKLANVADYPGVVGIETYIWLEEDTDVWVQYYTICTGTVISPTKVLTAGHCTVNMPFGTTFVIAGRNNLDVNSGGYVSRVATTWTHQNYHSNSNGVPIDDMSVLTLKDPLPAAYQPVTLSAQGDQTPYAAGTQSTIVGYGVTSPDGTDAGVLHEAKVPMIANSACPADYLSWGFDSNRMVCAGSPNATDPSKNIDSCHGDSGGPIFVNGVEVGITDWGDEHCLTGVGVYEKMSYYANLVNEDKARSGLINLDWTGDGHSDLIGRYPTGELELVSGAGLATVGDGGINYYRILSKGWQGYTKIFRVYNWNNDGKPSIMARDAKGNLYQYKSDGYGKFVGSRQLVGTSWNAFTDIMVTNNWMGDGRPNIMGRLANGDLRIYTSDGNGGWVNKYGITIGTGWNAFNTVLTPGSWRGDGYQSLIGRLKDGRLFLYNGDGKGGFANKQGILIGTGWNSFKIFMSPGDWNGDNMIDLVGITPAGVMRLYTTNGKGSWIDGHGKQIGQYNNWSWYNQIF